MKILIIEDDVAFAGLVERFMSEISSDIVIAHSFRDAIKALTVIPLPDVITLDLALPDSDTEKTISQIHVLREANEKSVILVLSGIVTPIDRNRIIQAGADEMLLKNDMLPMGTKGKGFMANLYDVISFLIKQPVRYQANVRILELLAERLSKNACQSPSP